MPSLLRVTRLRTSQLRSGHCHQASPEFRIHGSISGLNCGLWNKDAAHSVLVYAGIDDGPSGPTSGVPRSMIHSGISVDLPLLHGQVMPPRLIEGRNTGALCSESSTNDGKGYDAQF
jgi:hypothetical protein